MKRFLVSSLVFGVLHFLTSWICFTRSEVIRPDASTLLWRSASEILAFPFLYLQKLNPGFDAFHLLMILNSVVWGMLLGGFAVTIWTAMRKTQRS